MGFIISQNNRDTELLISRTKNKKKTPAAPALPPDNVASLGNPKKKTSSSSKSTVTAIGPETEDDPKDRDFVPPKRSRQRSEDPIEEIPLDQYGNEIVDNLPEVS